MANAVQVFLPIPLPNYVPIPFVRLDAPLCLFPTSQFAISVPSANLPWPESREHITAIAEEEIRTWG